MTRLKTPLLQVPLVRPLSSDWSAMPDAHAELLIAVVNFWESTVSIPVSCLTFNEVLMLAEAIRRYGDGLGARHGYQCSEEDPGAGAS